LLVLLPFSPVAVIGGLGLIILLPGAQLMCWLGLYESRWDFKALTLSVVLGLVTSPLLTYWVALLLGFNRWVLLVVFSIYSLALAAWVSHSDAARPMIQNAAAAPDQPDDSSSRLWLITGLLIAFTALGVFLAYFELETAQGYYPVQMEDWQKHVGVAFALRETGIPPTSPFFYGMFPDDQLVYYYMLHLNGATLDLLQGGGRYLHEAFVLVIVLASLSFSSMFFLLALTFFGSLKAATWSLAFATVIGGLDIIPIIHRTIEKYRENFPDGPLPAGVFLPREHIDNWVSALSLRLNTFFAYYIWVPQHLTGLTILCLGCYLYLKVKDRRKLLIIMPVLLFALLGHSTWIAALVVGSLFVFALLQIVEAYRSQGVVAARTLFFGYLVVAVGFAIVAAPFIMSLTGPQAPRSGIVFEIPSLDSWPLLRPFQANFGPHIWARLLDLPLHFFIEMGALLIAGLAGLVLYWRQRAEPPQPLHPTPNALLPFWLLLLVSGTLIASFFASGRAWAGLGLILNNDLGLRALMPGQLVLALFAGYFMARWPTLAMPRWWRSVQLGGLAVLIGLGLAYAGWEFVSMGLAKYWTEPQLSPDLYRTLRALPEVTQAQDKPLPVVQHRLHRDASRFQLSLGRRPVGFSTGEAIVFHRDIHNLALALDLSEQAFDNGLPLRSYQMFQNLGADYIFVGPAEREAMRHPEKYRQLQYFRPVFRQGDYEIYEIQPAPYSVEQPQASFDEGVIEFEGFFIDASPVWPGEEAASSAQTTKGLVTAWRLTGPTAKDYTIFIHLVDTDGQIMAQADHQLWAWDVKYEGPTTTWTPNLTHLDIIPIPTTALAAGEPLSIRLGLWLPDTGQHFPVATSSLKIDAGNRLIIGTLAR
jgi:hypothetical protein